VQWQQQGNDHITDERLFLTATQQSFRVQTQAAGLRRMFFNVQSLCTHHRCNLGDLSFLIVDLNGDAQTFLGGIRTVQEHFSRCSQPHGRVVWLWLCWRWQDGDLEPREHHGLVLLDTVFQWFQYWTRTGAAPPARCRPESNCDI